MKSNSRRIGMIATRSFLGARGFTSCPRHSSLLRLLSSSSSLPHRSLHLRSSASTFIPPSYFHLVHRAFSSSPHSPSDMSKPTFYDNINHNYNPTHDMNEEISDNTKNQLNSKFSAIDAIEKDEFLPPPSSSPPWGGALNPDGDQRDCTGKDPPERSKFLLVKHSTLMKLQHLVWILIALFFINSYFTERRMAHAEEKPGLSKPPSEGAFSKIAKWIESTFGYYLTQLNDKVGFGGHSMLLPPQTPDPYGRPVRTVVVNFEKTLVNSEWSRDSGWVLTKRPYAGVFLEKLGRSGYEVVLFTDMNQFDCEQSILDLDQTGVFRHRLFKESTNIAKFHFVKDLNRLGRDLKNVVMVDHLYQTSGILTPDNCIPISPWTGDLSDKELYAIAVLLEKCSRYNVPDMREVVKRYRANPQANPFVEEEKRAAEQERLLREEEGSSKSRKSTQTDNKSGGGVVGAFTGFFGRK